MKKPSPVQGKTEEQKIGFEVRSEPLIPTEKNAEISKFSGSSPPNAFAIKEDAELPGSYGSNTMFLAAQEPYRLFTYWDIDALHYPQASLFLRCVETTRGEVESETPVPTEARNWYLPVSQASSHYFVELGYYQQDTWVRIARSPVVHTPPAGLSTTETFDYATLPLDLTFQQLLTYLQGALRSGENLVEAMARLQRTGHSFQFDVTNLDQVSGDERTLMELLLGKDSSFTSLDSNELHNKIKELLQNHLSSPSVSETSASLMGGGPDAPTFYMDVHAEVIFYGNTHPGSTVTIDSRPVEVRPDGTFRCHFIVPDEAYEVPIISESPDGLETRAAVLRFHRTPG